MRAGGSEALSSYHGVTGAAVKFGPLLIRKVVLVRHNLVSDGVFSAFDAIVRHHVLLCKGVA